MTYATAAPLYRAAGWQGVLPLPPQAKKNPPAGYTGHEGRDPDAQTVKAWCSSNPNGNLALRLPADIIGIDVDRYKRPEAQAELEQLIGCPLPPTICSGSKTDGSRIAYYRVQPPPSDKVWNNAPVEAIEIVQRGHRYCVAPPSRHPDGNLYRWWSEADQEWLDEPPTIDDDRIATLPWDAQQRLLEDRNTYDGREAVAVELDDGRPSPPVTARLQQALQALQVAGGRHDATRDHVAALARLAERGEPGVGTALSELRPAFIDAVGPDRASARDAAKEYDDLVNGALRLVATTEATTLDLPPVVVLGPIPQPPLDIETATGSFFVDWTELLAKERDDEEDRWLIEPLFAKGRGHVLYAPHKVGKSLLTLWAALHLATGDTGVVVLYLDYEMGEDDLQERVLDMHGDHPEPLKRLRYALLPTLPPLDTAEGGRALMAVVDAEQATWPDHHLVVIIDTTGRALEGEENSADTVRAFYRETGIRLKQRAVTWVRLDHAGKDSTKGQRGSSAKGDDVDVVWKLSATDDGLRLHRDAARMGWVPENVHLRRHEGPLRYEVADNKSWPHRTKECSDALDELDVPLDTSGNAAQKALRDADHPFRREVVLAAVRYRRETAAGKVIVLPDTTAEGQSW